jgi:hypothetical protein
MKEETWKEQSGYIWYEIISGREGSDEDEEIIKQIIEERPIFWAGEISEKRVTHLATLKSKETILESPTQKE